MKIGIIGLGLMGGSMALALRNKGLATQLVGTDNNALHAAQALERGLVDQVVPLEDLMALVDVVVLATPVDVALPLAQTLLDQTQGHILLDMGSTKANLVSAIQNHPKRGRWVATHPMWGTENSGPLAAVQGAFQGKACVICDRENTAPDALTWVENLYQNLGMHLMYMKADEHDMHVAYISHISHITSFALANTVLGKEREEEAIFELASGGFESTVRLAKSDPNMWVPIFLQNKENLLDVLNEHISQLRKFKACLEKENKEYLQELIQHANGIRRILG
ncbi:MAG: prephenate dehydrogenase [Sphingobacteriia bacterium]|nr:MAG: prephenate dehydrogenase [Sphingobacteriia bacterium]